MKSVSQSSFEIPGRPRDRDKLPVTDWARISDGYFETLKMRLIQGRTFPPYRAVDYDVYESVRHYLRRRHQVRSRGTNSCFSRDAVYGRLGVAQLRRVRMGSCS